MLCHDELVCSVTELPTKKQQLQALNLLVLLLPEANHNALKVAFFRGITSSCQLVLKRTWCCVLELLRFLFAGIGGVFSTSDRPSGAE